MELIAVFAPLVGFIITGLFGKQLGPRAVNFIACAVMLAAAFASVMLFQKVILGNAPYTTTLANWLTSGDFSVSWALRVDQLSVVMMCVVNIVSTCVHIYSVGYMSHDEARARFMSYLNLFTFAMLMLVTADNLLQLFFGWEGVGVASYLLIGFWNHKPSANAAAQKAFIVNRVGDFGLALGTMATFAVFGSIDFTTIFDQAASHADTTINFLGSEYHAMTVVCLLLFMGAMGKSAQLGLHTWLPDAMEGPTPVSALIHAATMVTAGVFLVARMSPIFEYAPDALMVVALVGAATAFVAATIGMTQFDIKRVIAYSTMSQLGYMFFALGVSAYGAAIFHLMTHAFFKALLFLGAGSVIHAMSDEQDMRNMGGIWKKIPVTYAMMWIGGLALAGIPFFAGYYSKDIILESAYADHTWFGDFAFWAGIAAAFMTAFYNWRLIIITFHGKPRADHHTMEHVHESPPVMLVPLLVLAVGAVFAGYIFHGGFVGSGHSVLMDCANAECHDTWNRHDFWGKALFVMPENDTLEAAHHVPEWVKKLPLVMGGGGIALAFIIYMFFAGSSAAIVRIVKPLHLLFFNKWYFDEIYHALFVKPAHWLGRVFWKRGDQGLIDRFGPDGGAYSSKIAAMLFSRFQSGFIYHYAFVMMIAVISMLSWFVFRAGQGS